MAFYFLAATNIRGLLHTYTRMYFNEHQFAHNTYLPTTRGIAARYFAFAFSRERIYAFAFILTAIKGERRLRNLKANRVKPNYLSCSFFPSRYTDGLNNLQPSRRYASKIARRETKERDSSRILMRACVRVYRPTPHLPSKYERSRIYRCRFSLPTEAKKQIGLLDWISRYF